MRSVWTWLLLCIAALALAGCGGGDSNNNQNVTGNVTMGVNWAARSRNVNAPSSAQSVTATIVTGSAQNTDVVVSANRNTAPAAYTETLTFPASVRAGQRTVEIRFYANTSGTGAVVGTASTTLNVVAGTNSIGNVTTTNSITSVSIAPNLTLLAGLKQDLNVTARDTANNIVAVTPGSILYNVTAGSGSARIVEGQVEGVGAGTATVIATIDGIASTSTTISISPQITRLQLLENGALYGKIRLRLKGIGATTDTLAIRIGTVAATTTAVTFTDANAPAESSILGGAVDFVVPAGLAAGAQALIITVNGVPSLGLSVGVSNINPHAVFTLANGSKFVAELRRDKAPNTVDNFTGLAAGTKEWTPTYLSNTDGSSKTAGPAQNTPLYDGIKFHRVTNINASAPTTKIVQGGDAITKQTAPPADWTAGTGNPGFLIPFEANDLLHEDGALAMARSQSRDSAGSQFYVTDGAHDFLNGNYVVFGRVVEGLTIAKGIAQNDVLQSVVISGKLDSAVQ